MKVVETRLVLMDEIYVDPKFNCRKGITEESIESLAASIAQFGLQQPVSVRMVRRERYKFHLIAGHRRFEAHMFLGKTEIEAKIYDCTKREAHILNLMENIERKKLTILEEALGLLACFSKKTTFAEMSRVMQRNVTWIKTRWDLAHCHPYIQDAFMRGILRPTDLKNVTGKCPNPEGRLKKYLAKIKREPERESTPQTIMLRIRNKLMEIGNMAAIAVFDYMRGDITHPQLWKVLQSEQKKDSCPGASGEIQE